MLVKRFFWHFAAIFMLSLGRLGAQPCAVNLGPDTSLCAASYLLQPALSISTFEDSLEIVYDATQGQTGLVGAAKVYMHSAAEMVPFGGWQNGVGNWGQDDGIGQMTNIGTDLWRIRLVPHVYYNYAANVTPNGLFMVFRNADGSATGKDASGNDIWVDMGQDPPTSAFTGVQMRWIRDALDSLFWSDGSGGSQINVTTPGTYWVEMTDTTGCQASDTIVVSLGAIPLVNLGQPAICDSLPTLLDAGAGYASYALSTGATTQTINLANPGFVSVTVTNTAGCTGIDVVNVPAATSPTASFTTVSNWYTVQFIDASTGGGDYQWDFESDGNIDAITAGSTSFTYNNAAIYTATLIVTNACGSDTMSQTFYVGEIGFEESWLRGLSIYPNPAQNRLYLDMELNKGISLQWKIMDARGVVVLQGDEGKVAGNVQKEFDLQELHTGIYRLQLLANGRPMARSFLKM